MKREAMVMICCLSTSAAAVEVKPVIEATAMGGQNYYNGSDSSFGGVGSLTVGP